MELAPLEAALINGPVGFVLRKTATPSFCGRAKHLLSAKVVFRGADSSLNRPNLCSRVMIYPETMDVSSTCPVNSDM